MLQEVIDFWFHELKPEDWFKKASRLGHFDPTYPTLNTQNVSIHY